MMVRSLLLAALLGTSALPAAAQSDAGAYLAGRAAQLAGDFEPSVQYLSRALADGADQPGLAEALTGAYISLGDFDSAAGVAEDVIGSGTTSQVASLALLTQEAALGAWDEVLTRMEDGVSVGPLYDDLLQAWALIGDGQVEAGLARFDQIGAENGQTVEAFGLYHKALALASLNRFEEAAAIFNGAPDLQLTRRGLVAQIQILAQAGRMDEARQILEDATGETVDPVLRDVATALSEDRAPDFTIAPDPQAGVAEVAFDIANAVAGETEPGYTLLYSRAAQELRPSHEDAILMSAILLEQMERHALAAEAYARIPEDSPAFRQAELGRAEVLRAQGRDDEAIQVVRDLAERYPNSATIQTTLGDALRQMSRFEEARDVYDQAISLLDTREPNQWVVYFARGIVQERLGDWEAADADFRTALELNDGQPQVLNYLGYSMVERGENLDEALSMIERAVEEEPEAGHIVDSLGWARYRLGQYQEAVAPMERAVELMPVDPVVNDHLGDVLWAVGRKLEARFQWQRALSFIEEGESTDADPERIRRKLDVGLDQVLEENGEDPLKMADG